MESLITVPSIYSTSNTNADLILFIGYKNDPGINYNAYASACLQWGDKRPVAGYIIYNSATLDYKAQALEFNVNISTHEILHILGVNLQLFPHFKKTNAGLDFWEQDSDGKHFLQGDIFVEKAKEHFGCETLAKYPMENEGTEGNIGNHLESRIFGNELMTASAKIGFRFSKMSLAILQDSGWYFKF